MSEPLRFLFPSVGYDVRTARSVENSSLHYDGVTSHNSALAVKNDVVARARPLEAPPDSRSSIPFWLGSIQVGSSYLFPYIVRVVDLVLPGQCLCIGQLQPTFQYGNLNLTSERARICVSQEESYLTETRYKRYTSRAAAQSSIYSRRAVRSGESTF